jgi:hypothetical protein
MTFSQLAHSDSNKILFMDGEPVTITDPLSNVYQLQGMFVRAGVSLDAEGLRVIGETASITVSLDALAAAGITDPETLKTKGWTAEIRGIPYRLADAPIDYFSGVVTIVLKRSAANA